MMYRNSNDKMQHDAFEFYKNLIDNLPTQGLTVEENLKVILMSFLKSFGCGRVTGNPLKSEQSVILSILQLKKPVTL